MARKLQPIAQPLGVFAPSPDMPENPEAWCREYRVSLDHTMGSASASCGATLPTGNRVFVSVDGADWTTVTALLHACIERLGAKPR